jgi:hypothetical protein
MSHGLLEALAPQILADLARSRLLGALPLTDDIKGKRGRLPELAYPPTGEDMGARLRSIRHYITPRELSALLHWHPETVYRKIKSGMPADRDVDAQGRGRRLKIYPPEIADWLRSCREAQKRPNQLPSSLPAGNREGSESNNVVECRK